MAKILIVEDDPQIAKVLKMNLKLSGHETESVTTVNDAWETLRKDHFDLMCLDIGLPDGSGIDLCEKVRSNGDEIPILFMSARTDEATVVKGITTGGDDYIRKPFGMEELKARMNKVMKRFTPPSGVITFGALTIDPVKRLVMIAGEIVNMGRKEMDILMILARRAGDIVTRDTILTALYDGADMYDRTVDSHMSHLRRKLRDVAGENLKINSVYGLGYRLEWKGEA
ncbi:MAG: response regulator transcription factor [Bacteriovoracaceae bacterium]